MAELSVRYACALLDLSIQSGRLDEYLEQAAFLRDALADDSSKRFLEHPLISGREKRRFFTEAFGDSLCDDLMGFLFLTVSKGREGFIVPALTTLMQMGDRLQRRTTADVVSAMELDEGQIESLRGLLSKKLDKQVQIAYRVDPSLIGGLYIHVDGYLIDRTVKTQLRGIREFVKEGTADDPQAR